jgi:UPF0271 protein
MGADEQVMPYIDQANIACGFHAGDPVVMAKTLALAKQHGVSVGAHPSYPDTNGFGRRSMQLSDNEVIQLIHYQIATLVGMAAVQGLSVDYVKPHGALYNDMMKQPHLRGLIMQAVAEYPLPLSLMLQATPEHAAHTDEAAIYELPLLFEAFADRCYTDEGLLVSRSKANAVLDETTMLEQVKQLLSDQSVTTESGKILALQVDSICVHGDNETGVKSIQRIRGMVNGHSN